MADLTDSTIHLREVVAKITGLSGFLMPAAGWSSKTCHNFGALPSSVGHGTAGIAKLMAKIIGLMAATIRLRRKLWQDSQV